MYKEYFQEFPDLDRENTPIFKSLYKIDFNNLEERLNVIQDIRDSRDLNQAFGKTLDLHGKDIDLPRPPGMSDDDYRVLIKIKIMISLSSADIESINKIMSKVADNFISVQESWNNIPGEPASLMVVLENTITAMTNQILHLIKPGGVNIYPVIATNPIEILFNLITYEFPVELRITEMFRTETIYQGVDRNYAYIGSASDNSPLYYGDESDQTPIQLRQIEKGDYNE